MTIVLNTARRGTKLKPLGLIDSHALFTLIDRDRDHLSRYREATSQKFPDHASVIDFIDDRRQRDRARYGIWIEDLLVGMIVLRPLGEKCAELGFWVGSEFTRKGTATYAADALCQYGMIVFGYIPVLAATHPDNIASQRVLAKIGFRQTGTTNMSGHTYLAYEKNEL